MNPNSHARSPIRSRKSSIASSRKTIHISSFCITDRERHAAVQNRTEDRYACHLSRSWRSKPLARCEHIHASCRSPKSTQAFATDGGGKRWQARCNSISRAGGRMVRQ